MRKIDDTIVRVLLVQLWAIILDLFLSFQLPGSSMSPCGSKAWAITNTKNQLDN